ncbi:hypothetical protein COOONC_05920 [Cooperia oncophora]
MENLRFWLWADEYQKELRALIPAPPSQLLEKASESTSALLKLLDRARVIKREREDVVKEIQAKIASPITDDVKAEMNDFLGIDDDDYITEHVEKNCQPVQELVTGSIKKQEYLLRDIENWSARFSIGNNSESTSQRGQVLRSLQLGYDAFREIHRKLDEKMKVYSNQTATLRRLQVKVNDFAFARLTEKEELLRGRQIFDSSRRGPEPPLLTSTSSAQSQTLNSVTAPLYPTPTFVQGAAYTNVMTPTPPPSAQSQFPYPQYPYYGAAQANVQPSYNYSMPSTATTQNPQLPPGNRLSYPSTSWHPY